MQQNKQAAADTQALPQPNLLGLSSYHSQF